MRRQSRLSKAHLYTNMISADAINIDIKDKQACIQSPRVNCVCLAVHVSSSMEIKFKFKCRMSCTKCFHGKVNVYLTESRVHS